MISELDRKMAIVEQYLRDFERDVERIKRRGELSNADQIKIGKRLEFINTVRALKMDYRKQLDLGLGKLPPQDLKLEQAILGAIVLESKAIERLIKDPKKKLTSDNLILLPSHFYVDSHKEIFMACQRIIDQSALITLHSVVVELRRVGKLESVGAHYLTTISSAVSSSANLAYNSRCLIEFAIKRELILMAGTLLHDAYSDASDCFELIEGTRDNLLKIENTHVR